MCGLLIFALTLLPGQGAYRWRWLPDSTLFTVDDGTISIISAEAAPLRQLLLAGVKVRWVYPAPRGRLALVWLEDGWARFDLANGEWTRIDGLTTDHWFHWSPDGTRAVFSAPAAALLVYDAINGRLREVAATRTPVESYGLRGIAWSPDSGHFLALVSEDGRGSRYRAAYIVDAETLTLVTLNLRGLSETGCLAGPTWSSDGSRFAWAVRPEREGAATQLRIYRADGQLLRRLAVDRFNEAMEFRLSWSPDGRWLAVGVYRSTCP